MTRRINLDQWRDRTEEPVIVWVYTGVWELEPVAVDDSHEIDAWADPDGGWTYNETYRIGGFLTSSDDVPRAFRRYLKRIGVDFYRGRTRTEYDGDVYEIVDRKTREPLFAAIPQEV